MQEEENGELSGGGGKRGERAPNDSQKKKALSSEKGKV